MARTKSSKIDISCQLGKRSNIHAQDINFLPSPSMLLNCACTDDGKGAFCTGRMINIIGDSDSSKTGFALGLLAEASRCEYFKNHKLIYDDTEEACEFDICRLFGEKLAKRIEPPAQNDDGPLFSDTIEDFHFNLLEFLDNDIPVVYVLDSFDALDSIGDQNKIKEMQMAKRKGIKLKGSYGLAKPRKSSEILRNICGKLRRTNSILIIISQTRENINPMSFEKVTRSGGKALKFYAFHEIWFASIKKLYHPSTKIQIGSHVRAKVSKNKVTGKKRVVTFPVYTDYGLDDIASMIDFMCENKGWRKAGAWILLKGFDDVPAPKIQQKKLIRWIEEKNSRVSILRNQVIELWKKIEDETKLNRKPKYI